MSPLRRAGLTGVAVVALSFSPPALADGLDVFKKHKCTECHSILSLAIKTEAEPEKGEKQPPDLSDVGTRHDAEWMQRYLVKEEKIEDKLHRKRFKGSPEELKAVSLWLETLKKKVK